MKKTLVLTVMTLFIACGCFTVGPDYKKKEPPVPARFTSLEQGVSRGDDIPKGLLDSWWSIFQDPALESLMNRVASQNLDVRIARARVQQARAQSAIASSSFFPEGSLAGDYRRVRRTETTVVGAAASSAEGREQDVYLAGFDASWEIDIFGGIRRGVEAANAELGASVDGLRDVLITLRGEIGRNYMELRGLELRINIARQEVKIRSENVEITAARAQEQRQAWLVNSTLLGHGGNWQMQKRASLPLNGHSRLLPIVLQSLWVRNQVPLSLISFPDHSSLLCRPIFLWAFRLIFFVEDRILERPKESSLLQPPVSALQRQIFSPGFPSPGHSAMKHTTTIFSFRIRATFGE